MDLFSWHHEELEIIHRTIPERILGSATVSERYSLFCSLISSSTSLPGVSRPGLTGHMHLRIAMNEAQHKSINLLEHWEVDWLLLSAQS